MAILVTLAAFVFLRAAIVQGIGPTDPDPRWAQRIHDVLQTRDSFVGALTNLNKNINLQTVEAFILAVQPIPNQLTGLDHLDISVLERDPSLIGKLLDQPEETIVNHFFRSKNLESNYAKRGLGFMLRTLRAYNDFRCIKALYSLPQPPLQGCDLPLDVMCSRVREDLGKQDKYTFSTSKICSNVKQCSGEGTPHPYGDSGGTSAQDACKNGNECDVAKAIPMMGALLWYKISAFIAQSLCYNVLKQPQKSVLKTELEDIDRMADVIMAYSSIFQWEDFFRAAVQESAYSNLDKAMSLVKERINSIGFASLACIALQADDMCTVGDIFKEYSILKKLQKDRLNPGPTRNLQLYERVDLQKMIHLKKDAVKHIDLLGKIGALNQNLQAAVQGISEYFIGLANYDQDIANADVEFLSAKMTEFTNKAGALTQKLESDIKAAMSAMKDTLLAEFIEESAILTAKIAEHFNPLVVIFGGVELGDLIEQTGKVANAAKNILHGKALMKALSEVYKDSKVLQGDFKDNANQISSMQSLVTAIKTNNQDQIGFDADKFIKAYGAYTPKVDRHRLAKNDALWAAFKDSTCDLLTGAEGVAAAFAQGQAGGMLLCERLEGTLAEFSALRENIFDFQFDLVDALAGVVRGNIAKKLASSITTDNDLLDASQLMLGFFLTQNRLQSSAAIYCDKLEYRNQGKTVPACSPGSGFFTDDNLDNLIAYSPVSVYHQDERFVYIPTRPQFKGDTGFINLPSLAKGNPVTFRLPANRDWLRQYNWLAREETLAPFVESFKLYLPLKTYRIGGQKRHSRTRIKVVSIAGSLVSDASDIVYNLPMEHRVYITVYEDGYQRSRCPTGKERMNPYSLCDNLPKICDTTTREPGRSMMPTILSTWKVSYTVETGNQDLTWDAPNPATNLLMIGKVKLRFLPDPGKKRGIVRRTNAPPSGCCTGNQYRPKWSEITCVPCPSPPGSPTDSVSNLRGYYCEKGDEDVAGEPPPTS